MRIADDEPVSPTGHRSRLGTTDPLGPMKDQRRVMDEHAQREDVVVEFDGLVEMGDRQRRVPSLRAGGNPKDTRAGSDPGLCG
ncbi:MAG TPA: hypothetical protein VH763_04755 [Gemmatimonadales bacterium]